MSEPLVCPKCTSAMRAVSYRGHPGKRWECSACNYVEQISPCHPNCKLCRDAMLKADSCGLNDEEPKP